MYHLPALDAYFDDKAHFESIRWDIKASPLAGASGIVLTGCNSRHAAPLRLLTATACMSRSLCTYTHPELEDGDTRRPCRSLRELKQLLAASRQLHFCDICLDGRKVLGCHIC